MSIDDNITYSYIHNIYIYVCVPVAQWLSIALAAQKVVGLIPREHTY